MGVLIESPVCYIDRGSIRRKKCSDKKRIPDEGAPHLIELRKTISSEDSNMQQSFNAHSVYQGK